MEELSRGAEAGWSRICKGPIWGECSVHFALPVRSLGLDLSDSPHHGLVASISIHSQGMLSSRTSAQRPRCTRQEGPYNISQLAHIDMPVLGRFSLYSPSVASGLRRVRVHSYH